MIALFFLLFINIELFARVRILTFHCNHADFIEMQYKLLNKFIVDDFELIVFNDAASEMNEKWIEDVCKKWEIKCVRFEPKWHLLDPINASLKASLQDSSIIANWGWNAATSIETIANHPSVRHSHVIQYALNHYGYDHDDIVVIMDGDNFPLKPLSIRKLLGSNDLVGFHPWPDDGARLRREGRFVNDKDGILLWVVFIAFNPSKLPCVRELQFYVDVVDGHPLLADHSIVDTGAAMYKYFRKHPELRIESYPWVTRGLLSSFKEHELLEMNIDSHLIAFLKEIHPGDMQLFVLEHFVHFSSGSFEGPDHQQKVRGLHKYVNEIVKQ